MLRTQSTHYLVKKGIILWLQEVIPSSCPQSGYFALLLMDNHETESVGTVAPELRTDLQLLLQKNRFVGLPLSDFVSFLTETPSPPSPVTVQSPLSVDDSSTRIPDWRLSGSTDGRTESPSSPNSLSLLPLSPS